MDIAGILKKSGFPPEAINDLVERFGSLVLDKNQYFVKYGEKMNNIGILYKGVLVSRYSSNSGVEITSKFYHPEIEQFVVDYYSFKNQRNSEEEIQAIEKSVLLTLSFDDFNFLVEKYPSLQKLVSSFAEESYIKGLNRIRDFQLLSAQEMVEKFNMTHEAIVNKVKIKDKASFLGISRNVYTKSFNKI